MNLFVILVGPMKMLTLILLPPVKFTGPTPGFTTPLYEIPNIVTYFNDMWEVNPLRKIV